MGSTSRRDDSYSRSLSPPGNTLPSSSRPSDHPQTGRPPRSGKSKSQSQNNNQLTDVSPQQELVSPPIEVRPSYQDYIRQRLPNEQIDIATGSGSGAASSRTRESRSAENRTPAIPIATSNSYQTTARRNDTARREPRDVEHETRSRGGLHPDEDRRGIVAQSSSSTRSPGRSISKDVSPQSQSRAGQPPAEHSQYDNRGVPPNERHPSIPGSDAMTRKDMSPPDLHHSTSQFHIQPISGFLVTPGPGSLLIQQGSTTGQTTLPANFEQVVGHFQQPPPYYEPRADPPTRGEPPSDSRTGNSRETYNESTPPRPFMPSPPEGGYGSGLSSSGWSEPYQAGQPNPSPSPGAPIGLHRTSSTTDRFQRQQLPQISHNDTFRPRPSMEHHPTASSDVTTRNDRHPPRARESRETFDHHPGPLVGPNPPTSPPAALLSTANNIRGRYSNSQLSGPGSSSSIRPGEPTSTRPDQHLYPPSSHQTRSQPIAARQPSPQPPPRIPNPNPPRGQPKRKGGLAGLCGCSKQ